MKNKVIKINEKGIETLVKKILKEEGIVEDTPRRELDRTRGGFRRDSFDPYPRESQIMDIFGPWKNEVPPQVIQYLRKNPASVIRTLKNVYGRERMLGYMGE